ncbi:hypothetical protein MRB53_035412 [Persea americana]|uniref:Uncharacterized protein n=1 Tax=Persea americana TaxID=3435 RepID=A0ACC2K4M0_PERAE|nr:hypothetical protein MRB53_035412 [Persea americana]
MSITLVWDRVLPCWADSLTVANRQRQTSDLRERILQGYFVRFSRVGLAIDEGASLGIALLFLLPFVFSSPNSSSLFDLLFPSPSHTSSPSSFPHKRKVYQFVVPTLVATAVGGNRDVSFPIPAMLLRHTATTESYSSSSGEVETKVSAPMFSATGNGEGRR